MNRLSSAYPVILICLAFLWSGCQEEFPQTYALDLTETVEMAPEKVMDQMHRWSAVRGWPNPPLDLNHEAANHFDLYEKTRLYYQYGSDAVSYDTLWVEDTNGDPIPGDPYDLEERRTPELLKQYIGPEGLFQWRLTAAGNEDCDDLVLLIRLEPATSKTVLSLVSGHIGKRCGQAADFDRLSPREYLESLFHKEILEPLTLPIHSPE